jgi:hypothetical protein
MVEGFKVDWELMLIQPLTQLKIEICTTIHIIFTILKNLINRHL